MRITYEDNKIGARKFSYGAVVEHNGELYMIVDPHVYEEELTGNMVYVVRLRDGMLDGFTMEARVTPINAELVVKED